MKVRNARKKLALRIDAWEKEGGHSHKTKDGKSVKYHKPGSVKKK